MTRAARTSTSAGYPELMRQVAPLLGYDPRAANRKGIARYRSRGSLKIDFDRGTFSDFEAGIAGGVLDFIRHVTDEDARIWLERQGFASRTNRYSLPRMMAAREIPRADLGAEPRELTDEQRASANFARAILTAEARKQLRSLCAEIKLRLRQSFDRQQRDVAAAYRR